MRDGDEQVEIARNSRREIEELSGDVGRRVS